jgi:hypothetical protein
LVLCNNNPSDEASRSPGGGSCRVYIGDSVVDRSKSSTHTHTHILLSHQKTWGRRERGTRVRSEKGNVTCVDDHHPGGGGEKIHCGLSANLLRSCSCSCSSQSMLRYCMYQNGHCRSAQVEWDRRHLPALFARQRLLK